MFVGIGKRHTACISGTGRSSPYAPRVDRGVSVGWWQVQALRLRPTSCSRVSFSLLEERSEPADSDAGSVARGRPRSYMSAGGSRSLSPVWLRCSSYRRCRHRHTAPHHSPHREVCGPDSRRAHHPGRLLRPATSPRRLDDPACHATTDPRAHRPPRAAPTASGVPVVRWVTR